MQMHCNEPRDHLGAEVEEEKRALHLQPVRAVSPKDRILNPGGFNVKLIYHRSLLPAQVSIILLPGLGALSPGVPSTAHVELVLRVTSLI